MKMRLLIALLCPTALATTAWAGSTTIVAENFDSYADQGAYTTAWEQKDNLGFGRTSTYLVPNTSVGLTPPNDDPPGLQGKGVNIGDPGNSGIWSEYVADTFSLTPSATESVRISGDIFDDAAGNKRTTIGLRSNSPANIVELGYWNANTFDPEDPINTPSDPDMTVFDVPTTGFAYRLILFGENGGDLVRNPDWQYFPLDPALDIDLGGLVTPADIGEGWHRYSATITPTEVTLTLDLFRDGLANSEATAGVGLPGVDSTVTWQIMPFDGAPFDSLRIGGPSGVTSANESVVDNILLELVDVAGDSADFDEDGDIDGRDFLFWQRGNGIDDGTAQRADGDANLDGNVNEVDLGFWQAQFGTSPITSTLSAVPEPSSVGLLILAMAGATLRRRGQ